MTKVNKTDLAHYQRDYVRQRKVDRLGELEISTNVLVARCQEYVKRKADYNGNGFDHFCECYDQGDWENFLSDMEVLDWPYIEERLEDVAAVYAQNQKEMRSEW